LKDQKEKADELLIQQLQVNKELQEKVNRELEEKVSQRTIDLENKTVELQDANENLKRMASELDRMASKLDKDNWLLNKEVIEEKKARLLSKGVSFNDFSKIFPTELSCLTYLEDLKWKQGFICKKCQNNRFSFHGFHRARKCTRCNYVESLTTSTVFQGVRFPLNKAFYLMYVSVSAHKDMSLEEVSSCLGVSRVTCSKFRNKIQERISKTILKKGDHPENWEQFILDRS
ncbi:MAG: transposase, partial [Cytophagaceae bacterium]